MASAIPYRNLNWLRNLRTVGPQGKIDGNLIAALFDDVSNSQGQLSDQVTSLKTAQDALAAAIKALQTPAPAPTTPSGSTTTGPANQVLATPNGTGGLASIRALVSADIPNLPENKITNLVSDLALKAPLASPALTGSPTAPTQTFGDNSTKLATDAFVQAAVAAVTPPVVSVFGRTGAVAAVSGDYVVGEVTGAAPLASPALTGTPTAPTPAALDNSTKLATTAYSDSAVAVEKARALAAEALLAPLASPALTGSPTAPTQTAGDNTTKIATDAFVQAAVAAIADTIEVQGAAVTTPFSLDLLVNGIGPVGQVKVNGFPVASNRPCMVEGPINVTSQRLANVTYQNTSKYPILVSAWIFGMTTSTLCSALSDSSPVPTTVVYTQTSANNAADDCTMLFFVMPGNYYKITTSGATTVQVWREFYCQNGTMTDSGDVVGSRSLNTVFHNTSTGVMFVVAQVTGVSSTGLVQGISDSSPSPTNVIDAHQQTSSGTGNSTMFFIVPAGHYFKITAASGSLSHWHEYSWNIPCNKSTDLILASNLFRSGAAVTSTLSTGAAYVTHTVPQVWTNTDPFRVRWVSILTNNTAAGARAGLWTDEGSPPFLALAYEAQQNASCIRHHRGPIMPNRHYMFADNFSVVGNLVQNHWWEYQLG